MSSNWVTALAHAIPDFGEAGGRGIVSVVEQACAFDVQASTGFGVTAPQVLASDQSFIAAVASAQPLCVDRRRLKRRSIQNEEPGVPAASEINQLHTERYIT
jgi:hypothetical protein